MTLFLIRRVTRVHAGWVLGLCLLIQGCSPYELRHEIRRDSTEQIWMSEQSQVKLRAAQTRVFDIVDRARTLEAVIATLQDLDFQVDVVDEELGVISGKKLLDLEGHGYDVRGYNLYEDDSLLMLSRTYRSWGPFWHRSDLVRITVTVRSRGERQLVVRVSSQYYLQALENPEPYQKFFRTLEQALFLSDHQVG